MYMVEINFNMLVFKLCAARKRKCDRNDDDIDGSKVVLRSNDGIMNMEVFFNDFLVTTKLL